MKLKEVKNWIDNLPVEFLEFDVVNGEDRLTNETVDVITCERCGSRGFWTTEK